MLNGYLKCAKIISRGWLLLFHSPYLYVGNNPVIFIDPDGAQAYNFDIGKIIATDYNIGGFFLDFLGLNMDVKFSPKTEVQMQQERILNHGLTDQEKTFVQHTAVETFITTTAKAELIALSTGLSLTGMGASAKITSLFFGLAAGGPTLAGDLYNNHLSGEADFSSFGFSIGLTLISILTPDPIDKVIGVANIGLGFYSNIFEYERQKWNLIQNIGP